MSSTPTEPPQPKTILFGCRTTLPVFIFELFSCRLLFHLSLRHRRSQIFMGSSWIFQITEAGYNVKGSFFLKNNVKIFSRANMSAFSSKTNIEIPTSRHFANSLDCLEYQWISIGTCVRYRCSEIKPLFYTHRCHEKDFVW